MADGSLIFDTQVDTKGMKKDLQNVGTVAKGVFTADIIENFASKAGQAISGLASGMVEVGAAFETSMSQVAATMGITSEEIANGSADFEKLSQAAKDMGATTKYTASQAAEGLNILAMAGLNADEAIETLPNVLSLAAAGAMDMGTAASYVTGAVKGFNDEMGNAGKYADIMAKGATMANTDVNALGAALSGAAATANAYGQSVESTSVALLRLAEQNVTGQEAATAMSRAMADLYTPTDKAEKALKQLGVATYDANGSARDFNDIVDDLNEALSGYSDEQKLAYENTIFTTFGMKAFQKMTVSTTETVDKFKTGIANASGSAMKQMETQIDNLEGKLAILNSATEAVGIEFYEIFEDTMKGAVTSASDAMTRFQKEMTSGKLKDSLDRLAKAIGNFADNAIDAAETILPKLIDGLAWLLDHTQEIGSVVAGLATAFTVWKVATLGTSEAMMKLTATLMANPYAVAAAAVIGLTVALVDFAVSCGTVETAADRANDKLAEMTQGARDAMDAIDGAIEDTNKTFEGLDETANHMEALKDRLIALNKIEELSASQKAEMAAIVQELNSFLGEEAITLDEEGHIIDGNSDAWEKNIDARIRAAKSDAAQEKLVTLYKELQEAELELAFTEDKLTDIKAERTRVESKLYELQSKYGYLNDEERDLYIELTNRVEELNLEEQGLIDTQTELNDKQREAQGTIDKVAEYIDDEAQAASDAAESNEDYADSFGGIGEGAEEASEELEEFSKAISSALEDELDAFQGIEDGSKATFDNIKKSMEDQITSMQNWSTNIKDLAKRGINQGLLEQLATMGPQGAAYVDQFVKMTDAELAQLNDLYTDKLSITEETQSIIEGSWNETGYSSALSYRDGVLTGGEYAAQAGDEIVQKSYEGMVGSAAWNSMSEEARQRLIDSIENAKDATENATELGGLIPKKTLESLEASDAWSQMPESIKHHLIMANSEAADSATSSAEEIAEAETSGLASSIEENTGQVTEAAQAMSDEVVNTMNETLGTTDGSSTVTIQMGQSLDNGLAEGIDKLQSAPIGKATSVANAVYTAFSNGLSQDKFQTLGIQIDAGLQAGIEAGRSGVVDAVVEMALAAYEAGKKGLDVNSPSKKFEWLGEMCIAGFEGPFDRYTGPDSFNDIVNASARTATVNNQGSGTVGGGLTQNIYVNREVSTASEMARAIRLESRYGLMRGVAIG